MLDLQQCDVLSLFLYRFALDRDDDIVNLEQDVLDLQNFPERLEVSYEAEWRSYVRRALFKLSSDEQYQLEDKLTVLLAGNNPHFNQLLNILKTAIAVNNSTQVTVLNSPLKNYVQQLLKL
ncbi:hypothetical protein KJ365_10850 [Glaciecola sp. XM2]|uniref:hypothetical protein n=1 Tax=Glaciecola sp. XM2 TaxID=1914931 RepID=UPI001BDEEFFF|nr:hypothetical protein [Glaciecola sp. XM2]MBT1451375.1 hypothetical protein [Glaciecola sp. XM2]